MRMTYLKEIRFIVVLSLVLALGCTVNAMQESPERVTEQIRSTIIYASVTNNTPSYNDWGNNRKKVGQFSEGEVVEIVRDRAFEWYLVRAEDGREGWIYVDSLEIPEDPETNREWLPAEILESYVNTRNLASKTDHLVWVDIDRQLTHVFVGKQGSWKLKHTMPCSTGKNVSPTLRGMHEIVERGDWFYTERLARGGQNWVQFSGPYMFHSLPMDKQGNIMDYTLLERRSSGCIRLSMEDSTWFHSFIKRKSTVFVD